MRKYCSCLLQITEMKPELVKLSRVTQNGFEIVFMLIVVPMKVNGNLWNISPTEHSIKQIKLKSN